MASSSDGHRVLGRLGPVAAMADGEGGSPGARSAPKTSTRVDAVGGVGAKSRSRDDATAAASARDG